MPKALDKRLRYLKYGFLLVFVILLPTILRDEFGLSVPYFCKWICPVGMLEGGVPLALLNHGIRSAAHALYAWKFAIFVLILALSVFIHRPFCKYVCPLGAFYALFQKISFLRLELNMDACVQCGACANTCKMQVNPAKTPNSAECIRCGECVHVCPHNALKFRFTGKETERRST